MQTGVTLGSKMCQTTNHNAMQVYSIQYVFLLSWLSISVCICEVVQNMFVAYGSDMVWKIITKLWLFWMQTLLMDLKERLWQKLWWQSASKRRRWLCFSTLAAFKETNTMLLLFGSLRASSSSAGMNESHYSSVLWLVCKVHPSPLTK